nr:jasmonate O-methyltransferase [Ipomoea batatas]
MECLQFLHMNKGEGDTSYAKNSTLQMKIMLEGNPLLEEALNRILFNDNVNFPETMGIADLGCSSGPNTLTVVSKIIGIVYNSTRKTGQPLPELRVYLNDLPWNDFNDIFMSLPAFYKRLKEEKGKEMENCFVTGVPGSFYGRLFPRKSLHFIHSSSSLHWLSQVPPSLDGEDASTALNKGKIYISKTSPPSVLTAYSQQFQKDFSLFLKSRSAEMLPGGGMVLSFMGRSSGDPTTEDSCYQWELLAQALSALVSKGVVEEEKVDCFNAPYYAPSVEEVKDAVDGEGSFIINRIEAFEVEWDGDLELETNSSSGIMCCETLRMMSRGERVAKTIRAVVESMLTCQFGRNVMDELFTIYSELVDDYISRTRAKYINLLISLTRKS